MAQTSIFWTTNGIGDGASDYTTTQLTTWIRRMLGNGVHQGYGGELAVTGVASPLSMAYGSAVVNGIPYDAQAPGPYTVAVPTPSTGTTGHSVVLHADYAAQTVRLAIRSSPDGTPTFPAVVVNEGVESEILLAHASITTGGVITVIDARDFLYYHTKVSPAMIDSRTRSLFIPAVFGLNSTDALWLTGNLFGIIMANTKTTVGYATFLCPSDYESGLTVTPVILSASAGNVRVSSGYSYGAIGEVYSQNTNASAEATYTTVADQRKLAGATALTSIALGDYVLCDCTRDGADVLDTLTDDLALLGYLVSYAADS